jgi:hypothetical protein
MQVLKLFVDLIDLSASLFKRSFVAIIRHILSHLG